MPNSEIERRAQDFFGKRDSAETQEYFELRCRRIAVFALSEIALFAEEAAKMCDENNDAFIGEGCNGDCHNADKVKILALAKKYAPQQPEKV